MVVIVHPAAVRECHSCWEDTKKEWLSPVAVCTCLCVTRATFDNGCVFNLVDVLMYWVFNNHFNT